MNKNNFKKKSFMRFIMIAFMIKKDLKNLIV